MEKTVQALKMALAKLFKYRYRVLAATVALMMALTAFHYFTNNNAASATLSLNYSEASSGLNPNSTRFNISGLVSESVMSRVIKAAGLEGEITWDELARCISTNSTDSGRGSSGSYISTTYQITYDQSGLKNKPKYLPGPDSMVKLICDVYKSYFLENYGDNKSILNYEPLVDSDKEPYIAISSLQVKLDQISRYINMRIKENKTFTDEATGYSFISLMKDVENLQDYEINNIYSFIYETGVSQDKDVLVSLEAYKNKIEGLAYDRYMAFYEADNNGIKLYDEAMSAVVMIPSVDSTKEFYMSRTKTATDEMARNADAELQEATSYKKSIKDTNYLIQQVSGIKANNRNNLITAASMIKELKVSVDEISEKLKQLDVSYIKYKTQNYLVFSYYDRSFSQKISLKQTAVETVGLIVLFYLALFFTSFNAIRKKKKHAKV